MNRIGYFPGEHIGNNVTSFLGHHVERNPEHIVFRQVSHETLKNWSFSLEQPLQHESISVAAFTEEACCVAAGYVRCASQAAPSGRFGLNKPHAEFFGSTADQAWKMEYLSRFAFGLPTTRRARITSKICAMKSKLTRWWIFTQERFDPLSHLTMIVLFLLPITSSIPAV